MNRPRAARVVAAVAEVAAGWFLASLIAAGAYERGRAAAWPDAFTRGMACGAAPYQADSEPQG